MFGRKSKVSEEDLSSLSEKERVALVKSGRCSNAVIDILAEDESWWVRAAVAKRRGVTLVIPDSVAKAMWCAVVETLRNGNSIDALRLIAALQGLAKENPQNIRAMLDFSLDAIEMLLPTSANEKDVVRSVAARYGSLLDDIGVPWTDRDLNDLFLLARGVQVFEDPVRAPWNFVLFRSFPVISFLAEGSGRTAFDLLK